MKLFYIGILLCILSCSDAEKKGDNAEINASTELGELINYTDPIMEDTVYPQFDHFSGLIRDFEPFSGIYNLDSTRRNFHQHTEFKFRLVAENDACFLYFVSCSEYGYSNSWKEGQIFGIIGSLIDSESNQYSARITEHRGENEFELTDHKVEFRRDLIIIYTGDYADYYVKIES